MWLTEFVSILFRPELASFRFAKMWSTLLITRLVNLQEGKPECLRSEVLRLV